MPVQILGVALTQMAGLTKLGPGQYYLLARANGWTPLRLPLDVDNDDEARRLTSTSVRSWHMYLEFQELDQASRAIRQYCYEMSSALPDLASEILATLNQNRRA